MAVEARHLNFFPSQLVGTREIVMNGMENIHQYQIHRHNATTGNLNAQMDFGMPLSGTTVETLLPFYNSVVVDSVPPMKAESGLTYNPSSSLLSRKRSRDQNQHHHHPIHQINTNCTPNNPIISYSSPNYKDIISSSNINSAGINNGFTFMGEDISFQIQQQQIEIDRLIAHHTEKLLLGMAERRKNQTRRLVAAIEEGIVKRLKAKEEEIDKMGKLNWVLEERIKTLCFENQIWRDLAQTNEATANALRANLEQVLSKVRDDRTAEADDAASSCGSSDFVQVLHRDPRHPDDDDDGNAEVEEYDLDHDRNKKSKRNNKRWCRNCGKEESCVLLLPCRHLCLCGVCGPTIHSCPVCKSDKNGTVNVNMS